jgi:alanyl-tRNA synthetase
LAEGKGIVPSNVEHGYVLRRLIRRAVRHGKLVGIEGSFTREIAKKVVDLYGEEWPELRENSGLVFKELEAEEEKFARVLKQGVKRFEKILGKEGKVSGKDAFLLYQSFGFPLEMTLEIAAEKGLKVDRKAFEKEFERHQALSRTATAGRFKSGLADLSETALRMHTATHLLHAALRKVLGEHVQQKGSNITPERLRFDFSHGEKLSKEQLERVECLVNEAIRKDLPVCRQEMPLSRARKQGALAFFGEKYAPEKVSVYSVEGLSKEVCAGPHVERTGVIGRFRIVKEEAVSAGVRRIKAVLE